MLSHLLSHDFCLCFQLKYISSLNCDDYVVELGEAEFGINLWTRQAVEAIAALDTQESDPNSFGKLQVRMWSITFVFSLACFLSFFSSHFFLTYVKSAKGRVCCQVRAFWRTSRF